MGIPGCGAPVLVTLLISWSWQWAGVQAVNQPISGRPAGQYWCKSSIRVRENTTLPCSNYITMISSYSLDKEASGLGELTDSQMQNRMVEWFSGGNTDVCLFYKEVDKSMIECCAGYEGVDCDQAICDPPCENNGNCSRPQYCECPQGYDGYDCGERLADISPTSRYCYTGLNCEGLRLDQYSGAVSMVDCCGGGGISWGGAGNCTQCSESDWQTQSLLTGASAVPNPGNVSFRTCRNHGQNYYRTFDGLQFSFSGRCAYIVYTDREVEVVMTPINCEHASTCKKKLTLTVNGLVIDLQGEDITIDGSALNVNWDDGAYIPTTGIKVTKNGDFYYLEEGHMRMKWDDGDEWHLTMEEEVTAESTSNIKGICGNYNGDPWDDMQDLAGREMGTPEEFCNSWREDVNNCPSVPSFGHNCRTADEGIEARSACNAIMRDEFDDCRKTVLINPYHQRCVEDYCAAVATVSVLVTKESIADDLETIVCNWASSYSTDCRANGYIDAWRTSGFCPRQCPVNMRYDTCVSKCAKTCATLYRLKPASCYGGDCDPGCQCEEGYVLAGSGKCVKEEECPCTRLGVVHQPGDDIKVDCNNCTCEAGRWLCEDNECDATCTVLGYNHIRTFDGFDYDLTAADCWYTLLQSDDSIFSKVGSVSIQQRVDDTCTERGITCIQELKVTYKSREGAKTKVNIEVYAQESTVMVDDVEQMHFKGNPYINRHISVRQETSLYISVEGPGFTVMFDANGRIKIMLAPMFKNKVGGLCGNHDDNRLNEYKSANNMDMPLYKFANSWAKLCNTPTNQDLQPCVTFNAQEPEAQRKCALVGDPVIFGSCPQSLPDSTYYRRVCEYDMCARGSTTDYRPLCTALAEMASACYELGLKVEWMSHPPIAALCHMDNEVMGLTPAIGGHVFTECAPRCRSCKDKQYSSDCNDRFCVAGYVCPDNHHTDFHGSCVLGDECTCLDEEKEETKVLHAGASHYYICTTCQCKEANFECDIDCSDGTHCPPTQEWVTDAACQQTCESLLKNDSTCLTSDMRRPGCGCPAGQVLNHQSLCVEPSECYCQSGADFYPPDSEIRFGCSLMKCTDQQWTVVQRYSCPSTCWTSGDVHYRTFDGINYQFSGECTYTLIEANDDSFSLTAQNIPCGYSDVTCTKLVTAHIGNHTIRLLDKDHVKVNDVTHYIGHLGVHIEHPSVAIGRFGEVFIAMNFIDIGLVVEWDEGTRVYVSVHEEMKRKVNGLCGDYNDKADDLKDPDSPSVMLTPQEFGEKWRTEQGCPPVQASEVGIDPCVEHPNRKKWSESTCQEMIYSDIFAKCREVVPEFKTYYRDCVYDSCNCNDGSDCECMCTALGNFAQECNRHGVAVRWRSNDLCPIQCDGDLNYNPCASPCGQSCHDLSQNVTCYDRHCVEGCFCPEGTYNHNGNCVQQEECPCYFEGEIIEAGKEINQDCRSWSVLVFKTWIFTSK